MMEGQQIVCFGPGDWWGMNPSCTTHIMRKLAARNTVLYVNTFSSDLLCGTDRTGLVPRVFRKAKSVAKFLRKAGPSLYVQSPIFLPFQGVSLVDRLNNLGVKTQILAASRLVGMRRPLVWLENVRAVDIVDFLHPSLVIYHVSDLFTEPRYTANRAVQERRERQASERSDVAICVSKRLYDAKSSCHPNVHYLPHGVDFDLFHEAAKSPEILSELAGIPRPIAGYFGTLTDSNDTDLLLHCARELPEVSFVFAGQITGGDYSGLERLPNTHFLGRMPYERIPALCANFDVCLLPWKISDWIKSCNPLKLFEYMAAGKPIVSVQIDEVVDNYADIVSIAENKAQFCEAIRHELQEDTEDRRNARVAVAKQHDWLAHLEQLSQIIENTVLVKDLGATSRVAL